MLYTKTLILTIPKIIVVIYIMVENYGFKTGQKESDSLFNERVADNSIKLEQLTNEHFKRRRIFEKRIFFRFVGKKSKKDDYDKQKQSAEIRQDTRELFLMDAKSTLDGVCRRNFTEFWDLEEAQKNNQPYEFKHYIQYSLKEEEMAQEGFEYRSTVGYKLAALADSKNFGDEMYIRFVVPEELILDDDTPEEEVEQWFDGIKDVYVEYDKKTKKGTQTEIFRISKDGLQSYPIDLDTDDDFMLLTDQEARKKAELAEIEKLKYFYKMLGEMELVPIAKTKIEL